MSNDVKNTTFFPHLTTNLCQMTSDLVALKSRDHLTLKETFCSPCMTCPNYRCKSHSGGKPTITPRQCVLLVWLTYQFTVPEAWVLGEELLGLRLGCSRQGDEAVASLSVRQLQLLVQFISARNVSRIFVQHLPHQLFRLVVLVWQGSVELRQWNDLQVSRCAYQLWKPVQRQAYRVRSGVGISDQLQGRFYGGDGGGLTPPLPAKNH